VLSREAARARVVKPLALALSGLFRGGNPETHIDAFADALLAVQDETARECAEMASRKSDECAEYGNIHRRAVADNLMLEIEALFGLEGK
jgi:hypothetical protein